MSNHDSAQALDGHHEHENHVLPLPVYFGVFGTLIFLTLVTVGVSYMGLPSSLSIMAAVVVASIKAAFVVGYFMHLKYDAPFNALVFFSSILFMLLFFAFTMTDLASRDSQIDLEGNTVRRDELKMQKIEKKGLERLKLQKKK